MHLLRSWLLRVVALFGRHHVRQPVHRVLVIKPDHLGDVLLLTPALRELRAGLPHTHITLMIGPWAADAVRDNPDVDALLFCAFPGFTRQPKLSLWQPYVLLLKTALLLRAGRYDIALLARDDHWWGALLALLAGIPRRIGYAAGDITPLLTDALPYEPGEHVAVQSLNLVAHLAGPFDEARRTPAKTPPLRAPITPADEAWAEAWLQAHGCDEHVRLVAIHPGAGGAAKHWIAMRWAMVADAIKHKGYQVVLTGGTGEQPLVDAIKERVGWSPFVLVGQATLGQLAALYRRCVLVLGVDSGPLHLATSTGVPTIALFGPIDHHRFGPWGQAGRHLVVRSGLWCSPCGVVDVCPRGTSPAECMTTIGTARVLAAIDALHRP
jgi:ADP-heptose:LPS heptosyltransferase